MSEILCSSSGQWFHHELPDIFELLVSSSSRALPLVCAHHWWCYFFRFDMGFLEVVRFRVLGHSRSILGVYYSQHHSLNLSLADSPPWAFACSSQIVSSTKPLWKYLQLDHSFAHEKLIPPHSWIEWNLTSMCLFLSWCRGFLTNSIADLLLTRISVDSSCGHFSSYDSLLSHITWLTLSDVVTYSAS
jgi:hypothetical protein